VKKHHYKDLPSYCFWPQSVADIPCAEVDPVTATPFTIDPGTRVVTGGSCFSQHLARHLKANGFSIFVTEDAHPMAPPELATEFGYGIYSARYGNVYTSKQLLQLFQRAHGTFVPLEDVWHDDQGRLVDPFRPRIQPGGFRTEEEYFADRKRHFAAVRTAFANLDVLVFTLGLTECWMHRADGAAYPLCPGVAGGTFDPNKYVLVNLEVDDVVQQMLAFIDLLRSVNPRARVILNVSAVSAYATGIDRHVLVSSTYSKSVLRVAADMVTRRRDGVVYFPGYEIIVGAHARGRYYAPDARSITEEGVEHVMRVFVAHFAAKGAADKPIAVAPTNDEARHQEHMNAMGRVVQALCDEEALGAA
jgi:hypothetical protein